MEHFDQDESKQLTMPKSKKLLPEFLSTASVRELNKLPAEFEVTVLQAESQQAKIRIEAKDAGTNATATIYYGLQEALTFSDRWQKSSNAGSIENGNNTVTITGLKPATEYYCRVLLENDQGKIWSMDTCRFETKGEG